MAAFWFLTVGAHAATFTNNARIEISDGNNGGSLTWKTNNNALSFSCWFKISIPSDAALSDNIVVLVNRRTGTEADNFSYLVQFNIFTGNIEFSARGTSGIYTNTLIQRPYLDRWYHIAVVRQGDIFTGYLDGRQVFIGGSSVGNSGTTDGVSIGGWGDAKYLYGEVQEFAVYQTALSQAFIVDNMFADQTGNSQMTGYYKLAYSSNPADQLRNFAGGVEDGVAKGSGTVRFEQTDEAGEQSAFDSRKNGGRDAMAPLSGSFSWEQTALSRPTPGITFDFRFGYGSANAFGGFLLGGTDPYNAGPLGPGWRHTFETRLLPAQAFDPSGGFNMVGLMNWNGSIETWDLDVDTGQYSTRNKEYRGELTPIGLTQFQWVTPDRMIYVFRNPNLSPHVMDGRLLEIRDFNSNSVKLNWNQTVGVITQIVDSVRGAYNLSYSAQNLLTNVSFGPWLVKFGYDATNRLVSKIITNTSGLYTNVNTKWQFQYGTNGLLSGIVDPKGITNILIQYDKYGRKTNHMDALGRVTKTEYNIPVNRQMRHTDPSGFQWLETYDRKGHMLAQQDPLGNVTSYTYDTNGNRTSVTEPLGYQTFFGYDVRANVIVRTNALGQVTRWVMHSFFNKAVQDVDALNWTNFYAYDAGGNITNHADALGTLVSYTYATNGLVTSSTDANVHSSYFSYDTNGFLISQTDAATNTTFYGRNEVGWKLTETNALGQVTSFGLDLNGHVVRTVDPLQRVFTNTFDADGNLLSASDGKGQLTQNFYDLANQKISTVDRASATNSFTYDSRGNVQSVTNALGYVTSQIYDAADRQISAVDPLGNTVSNIYNNNGKLVAFVDKTGQMWTKNYDRLNRVISETDPLGNTRQTIYDMVGRVQNVITPNGFPSTNIYDGRGRLVTWNDPQGYKWQYDYDGVANITNITDALNGHYVMTYGPRNERLTERNQDNFIWQYTYDPLLRLATQTDPNNTVRTPGYDSGGRITNVVFSTGRINSLAYDLNDNPVSLVRSQAGSSNLVSFNYDAMDRVTNQTGVASLQHVQYLRDALGRITTLIYPNGKALANRYDALNRLTNQVDWAGRQMTYQYDVADRLVRRTYPNGVVQSNAFDTAGRITSLGHSSGNAQSSTINAALTYAYDRNGNKTSFTENGTFNWPAPSLTDENANFTPAGRLIDRTITQPSTTISQLTYLYDPSGNMTNAAGGGQSWDLAYDEDNRVTTLKWDCNLTSKSISNRYDALGRRIERTVDGDKTSYVLDVSGGMERILYEVHSDLTQTYYIHGPDLCYKVNDDDSFACFHADAQGNIIALTGPGGTNLAQYAYTPYGRSLGSTNLSTLDSQPYTFVGSQGVMEELPGLYFMRARYYSADAGVFLSTDPVKKIGAGWRPIFYSYAGLNALANVDPKGEEIFADVIGFGAGLVGDFGVQLYKYYHDPNYSPSVAELWISGATGAVAGEVAEDSAAFAIGAGATKLVAGAFSVASTALFNGGVNVVQQSVDNGLKKIDLSESAETVFFSTVSGGVSRLTPNLAMNGNLYWHDIPGSGFGTSHLINTTIHAVEENAIDSMGEVSRLGSMASTTPNAGVHANQNNAVTVKVPAAPSKPSGGTSSSGGGKSSQTSGSHSPSSNVNTAPAHPQGGSNIINMVVNAVGSFFSGIFGGHH